MPLLAKNHTTKVLATLTFLKRHAFYFVLYFVLLQDISTIYHLLFNPSRAALKCDLKKFAANRPGIQFSFNGLTNHELEKKEVLHERPKLSNFFELTRQVLTSDLHAPRFTDTLMLQISRN